MMIDWGFAFRIIICVMFIYISWCLYRLNKTNQIPEELKKNELLIHAFAILIITGVIAIPSMIIFRPASFNEELIVVGNKVINKEIEQLNIKEIELKIKKEGEQFRLKTIEEINKESKKSYNKSIKEL